MPSKYLEDMHEAIQAVLHKHAENMHETGQLVSFVLAMEVLSPESGDKTLIHSVSEGVPSWHAIGILESFKQDLFGGPLLYVHTEDDDDD